MMNSCEGAGAQKLDIVVVRRALGRKVLGQLPPLPIMWAWTRKPSNLISCCQSSRIPNAQEVVANPNFNEPRAVDDG
jgi:hypothetical protein